jgi:amino acid adenylation domain-containing protein/non-ribosomal peptide synthase protein (TIGR01720 family)
MTVVELLSHLHSLDITCTVDGDRLRLNAPKGAITPALHARLGKHKAEIIKFLSRVDFAVRPVYPPIRLVPRDRPPPLSFAQQRLWFIQQIDPGSAAYNIPTAIRLTASVDRAALQQTLDEIVRRHEVLRTVFAAVDGQAVQIINPAQPVHLPIIDLQDLPPAEREAEVMRLATMEAQQPFDLERGPLMRQALLCLGTEEHVLLLTIHHIISDGWSEGVFVRELTTLYAARATGQPAALSELPIQYADYAAWQREWLQRVDEHGDSPMRQQLAYWKRQMAGAPALLELPTNRPRPVAHTCHGAHQALALPQELSEALNQLSRREGVSLFMSLLAAFQTLLYRYTGQVDIVVGSPIANRTQAETEYLIGCFANVLALRGDLSGNPSFRELLRRVREMALDAYAHQDVPFEKVMDALDVPRDLSHTPLFQVMFALQNAPMGVLELPGLTLRPCMVESGSSKFDLSLSLEETEHGISGVAEYNTDLFDAVMIARMLGHFQTLLAGIVANPDQRIADLPLLTAVERQQLLSDWNATEAAYPTDTSIVDLFVAQAERTPDAVAAVFADHQLTYRELNRRANRLAHYLQKEGVRPEVLVAVRIERSIELLVGVLAILKAGGAYVPLDPAHPPDRLAFMLEDSRASLLLTATNDQRRQEDKGTRRQGDGETETQHSTLNTQHFSSFLHPPSSILDLVADWPAIAAEPAHAPPSSATPDNLAYAIYTSGSTGTPKAVAVTHAGLLNLVFWHCQAFDVTAGARATQLAALGFDAVVWEIWPYLAVGARIHLIDEETRLAPTQLRDWLLAQAITICFLPTPLVAQMLDSPWPTQSALQTMLTGGDALHRYPDQTLPFRLINNYGPTENTVVTTSGCVPAVEQAALPPTIGRPIANVQVYVLDAALQPVPLGVAGELYIGGVQLARGYLNRPELTAEKFVPNPFLKIEDRGLKIEDSLSSAEQALSSILYPLSSESSRLYKTGDLARYQPDGAIEFLGRIDHQVKIRGYRIELGEIEALLLGHPAVAEGAIVLREDRVGEKRLVAYLVPNEKRETLNDKALIVPDSAFSVQPSALSGELRAFLKDKLPDYMVPSAFVVLDVLPLTPNGKLDRKALPAPDRSSARQGQVYVAPCTPTEAALAAIWGQVLGLAQVGVHDNFFELGGDSILSIQVVARANEAGLRLAPSDMFRYQNIAELAGATGMAAIIQAEQGVVTGPVPLTPIQRWFFEQDLPERHHWNQALLLEERQSLPAAALEEIAQHLLLHHDALRLRFTHHGASWHQVNDATGTHDIIASMDLSALQPEEQEAAITAAARVAQASCNLMEGPLLRIVQFNLGPQQPGRLLLVIHHLAVDGVSWRILLEDLQTAYRQVSQGQRIQLPAKTTAFKHWAERLADYAQSPALQQARDYWLAEPRAWVPSLPRDYPAERAANTEASAQTMSVSLSAEETRALIQDVPTVYRTQINDVLLTALALAYTSWTGESTLLVDLEGHGREELFADVDLSRTVGWYTTLFPVLLDIGGAVDPGEALKTVKERLRAIPNQGIGYGILRYMSDDTTAERLRQLPQAELSFNYLGQLDQNLADPTLFAPAREPIGPAHSPQSQRSHLLEINSHIVAGRLHIEWTSSKLIHHHDTIARLANGFIAALRALIRHCQTPEVGGYTPSDFPQAGLSQHDLDRFLSRIGQSSGGDHEA